MSWERGGNPEHISTILTRIFDDLAKTFERKGRRPSALMGAPILPQPAPSGMGGENEHWLDQTLSSAYHQRLAEK
jgi:hypothetical protein